jgi:hypothetical protein
VLLLLLLLLLRVLLRVLVLHHLSHQVIVLR